MRRMCNGSRLVCGLEVASGIGHRSGFAGGSFRAATGLDLRSRRVRVLLDDLSEPRVVILRSASVRFPIGELV